MRPWLIFYSFDPGGRRSCGRAPTFGFSRGPSPPARGQTILQACSKDRRGLRGNRFELVAPFEVADVLLHPGACLLAAPELDRFGDPALRIMDTRPRLRY